MPPKFPFMRKQIPSLQKIKENYEEIFSLTTYGEKEIFYELLSRLCRGLTLEVACGNNPRGILPKVPSCIGVDISEKAAQALTRQGLPVVVGQAESLPFARKSFQTVISLGALEHFFSPEEAVKEMNRVMKNGGILILTVDAAVPFYFDVFLKLRFWYRRKRMNVNPDDQPITRAFKKNALIHLLHKHNFRIVFHGEYSKRGIATSVPVLKNLLSAVPLSVKTSPFQWLVIAMKNACGQEDIYGPYFPMRGEWHIQDDNA